MYRNKPVLCLLLIVLFTQRAVAGMDDCIQSTCRISTEGSIGTGCVFEVSDQTVYILTNAHVVGSADRVRCEFWREGHPLPGLQGTVIQGDTAIDAAVVSISRSAFSGDAPRPIPLARPGTKLTPGQTVLSAGCARGGWPTAWVGHIVRSDNAEIRFVPPPAGGRSGSAIFDKNGTQIVGLLFAREDIEGEGIATPIDRIRTAFAGNSVLAEKCIGDLCPVLPRQNPQPSPIAPDGQSSVDLQETNRRLDEIARLLRQMQQQQERPPVRDGELESLRNKESELHDLSGSLRDIAAERLRDGSLGLTIGKIVGGALGFSGPLGIAVAAAGWFISRRLGKRLEGDDPLIIQRLVERLTDRVDDLRDRIKHDTAGKSS